MNRGLMSRSLPPKTIYIKLVCLCPLYKDLGQEIFRFCPLLKPCSGLTPKKQVKIRSLKYLNSNVLLITIFVNMAEVLTQSYNKSVTLITNLTLFKIEGVHALPAPAPSPTQIMVPLDAIRHKDMVSIK